MLWKLNDTLTWGNACNGVLFDLQMSPSWLFMLTSKQHPTRFLDRFDAIHRQEQVLLWRSETIRAFRFFGYDCQRQFLIFNRMSRPSL